MDETIGVTVKIDDKYRRHASVRGLPPASPAGLTLVAGTAWRNSQSVPAKAALAGLCVTLALIQSEPPETLDALAMRHPA